MKWRDWSQRWEYFRLDTWRDAACTERSNSRNSNSIFTALPVKISVYLRVAQYTDMIGFQTNYIHTPKCNPDTKYKCNPRQTELSKVLRREHLVCKVAWILLCNCIGHAYHLFVVSPLRFSYNVSFAPNVYHRGVSLFTVTRVDHPLPVWMFNHWTLQRFVSLKVYEKCFTITSALKHTCRAYQGHCKTCLEKATPTRLCSETIGENRA